MLHQNAIDITSSQQPTTNTQRITKPQHHHRLPHTTTTTTKSIPSQYSTIIGTTPYQQSTKTPSPTFLHHNINTGAPSQQNQ